MVDLDRLTALRELEVGAVGGVVDRVGHNCAADAHGASAVMRAIGHRLRHRLEEHDVALHQDEHPCHRGDAEHGHDRVPQSVMPLARRG